MPAGVGGPVPSRDRAQRFIEQHLDARVGQSMTPHALRIALPPSGQRTRSLGRYRAETDDDSCSAPHQLQEFVISD
jgi:hypothetical protein